MNGEIIKSFLVGLGFGVDDSSLQKFNKAIQSAGVRVAALYAGVQTAAAGIFYGIAQISEGFEQMGYEYRIIAPAINKAILLRNALLSAYRAAGINITKVVQESVKFNFSLAKTKFALDAIYKSVGAKFIPLLTQQMDIFRSKIYANMPRIQAALEKFVKFVFKAFDATIILGQRVWSILGRVYDFFSELDKKTDGWSTIILGVVAAWRLLNLSFIATPIGMLITGLMALLTLYDDFKTYQEGGESFFNWGPVVPIIDAVTETFSAMLTVIKDIFGTVGILIGAFMRLFHLDFQGFFEGIKSWAMSAFGTIKDFVNFLMSFGHVFGSMGNAAAGMAVNANGGQYFNPSNYNQTPIGAGPGSGVNQNMNAQTTINVSTSDPSAAGNMVLSGQKNVNADQARNMKARAR